YPLPRKEAHGLDGYKDCLSGQSTLPNQTESGSSNHFFNASYILTEETLNPCGLDIDRER
ncbi:MAG: hypothetical protein ACPH5H_07215, partial [Candidatus Poseidoniaceae archaeon]